MNKIYSHLIAGILLIGTFTATATNWNQTKSLFKYQKEIDGSLSSLGRGLGTVYFHDTLFNFIGYQFDCNMPVRIVLRKLTNHPTPSEPIHWKMDYELTGIPQFQNLHGYQVPVPVVFKGELFIFYFDIDFNYAYSAYNASNAKWSDKVIIPALHNSDNISAAVIVNDKLCLISPTAIYWTTDMLTWHTNTINIPALTWNSAPAICALGKTYLENDTLKSKLMIGYIDQSSHAICAEYRFNTSNQTVLITSRVVANDDVYSSIALGEGSVYGDPASSGDCVQAFLKKEIKDVNTSAYRIERYQSKDRGNWTQAETNLLPYSSPDKMWADQGINLSTVNFAITDTNSTTNITQYMCLFYRGSSGGGLNGAWAQTDKIVRNNLLDSSKIYTDPATEQFIGYIEGVPPFYFNGGNTSLINDNVPISSVEITNDNTVQNGNVMGFDVKTSLNIGVGCFKSSYTYEYEKKFGQDFSKSVTQSNLWKADTVPIGHYLIMQPVIYAYAYDVKDTKGNVIYHTYYFVMTEPQRTTLPTIGFVDGMKPNDPKSYMHRCIKSEGYDQYDVFNCSWSYPGEQYAKVKIKQSDVQSSTHKHTIEVGLEGEFFGIKTDGSLEYTLTTTTEVTDIVRGGTALNNPGNATQYPKDIQVMDYSMYWLKRTNGLRNWWLFPGQDTTENTWCVTYEVTHLMYMDGTNVSTYPPCPNPPVSPPGSGDTIHGTTSNNDLRNGFSLAQNHPNPVNSTTKFNYSIGKDENGASSCSTRLTVYNLNGNEVAVLVNEHKTPGNYEVSWDAGGLTPGIYFYSLVSGNFHDTKKLVILR